MSIFSKWWPRWCLVVELRWPTKNHIHYTSYTKWTGEEVNEVSDLQAVFALHIFQSDYESSLTRESCSLLNITIKLSLIQIMPVPKDSALIMSHSPLHCMLSWAVCNYYSCIYSDNAEIISIKQLKSTGKLLTIQLEDLVTPVHS